MEALEKGTHPPDEPRFSGCGRIAAVGVSIVMMNQPENYAHYRINAGAIARSAPQLFRVRWDRAVPAADNSHLRVFHDGFGVYRSRLPVFRRVAFVSR